MPVKLKKKLKKVTKRKSPSKKMTVAYVYGILKKTVKRMFKKIIN